MTITHWPPKTLFQPAPRVLAPQRRRQRPKPTWPKDPGAPAGHGDTAHGGERAAALLRLQGQPAQADRGPLLRLPRPRGRLLGVCAFATNDGSFGEGENA